MADRLGRLIEAHMLCPFVWGQSDCCLAVCNVLRDLGWSDPAKDFRGRYHNETGARRIIGQNCEHVVASVCRSRGWAEINAGEAQDGDVGVIGRSLVIFCSGWWYAKSEDGCIAKKRVRRAWRPE